MKTLLIILAASLISPAGITLFDFNSAKTSGQWFIVNDGVMGGVSQSKINLNGDGTATFSGTLSPDNNGGFASVRTKIVGELDNDYKGVSIRLKGDGNIYSLRFRSDSRFDGYSYQAKVQTEKEKWVEFNVPFKEFTPTYRGYTLTGKPELVANNIAQMGIMVSDKQWGEFAVDIDWIKFYK